MTKWVTPCKIIELSENTLRLIHLSRPDVVATLTKADAVAWPKDWRLFFNSKADVALSFNVFDPNIKRCNFRKDDTLIDMDIKLRDDA